MGEHLETTVTLRRRPARDEARELLKRLQVENPTADRETMVKLFVEHIRPAFDKCDDPEVIETLILPPLREWVRAQIVEPRVRRKSREQRAAEKAALLAEIEKKDERRVEDIVTRRLLDLEMPDGRALGDLTGADCRNLSERLGVFFHVISDQIPPRAKVRNHYTELELQALARHHKLIVS